MQRGHAPAQHAQGPGRSLALGKKTEKWTSTGCQVRCPGPGTRASWPWGSLRGRWPGAQLSRWPPDLHAAPLSQGPPGAPGKEGPPGKTGQKGSLVSRLPPPGGCDLAPPSGRGWRDPARLGPEDPVGGQAGAGAGPGRSLRTAASRGEECAGPRGSRGDASGTSSSVRWTLRLWSCVSSLPQVVSRVGAPGAGRPPAPGGTV